MVKVIDDVPWPDVMVLLAGAVHVYPLAPATAATAYVSTDPGHTLLVWPFKVTGVDGVLKILSLLFELLPKQFTERT